MTLATDFLGGSRLDAMQAALAAGVTWADIVSAAAGGGGVAQPLVLTMEADQTDSPFVIKDSDGTAVLQVNYYGSLRASNGESYLTLTPEAVYPSGYPELWLQSADGNNWADLYTGQNNGAVVLDLHHDSGGSHYLEAGATPKLGLFGKAAVAQQAKPTDATSIIALLVAYGLCPAA